MLYSFFVPAPAGANICLDVYFFFNAGYNRNINKNTKKSQKILKNYKKGIDNKKNK